MQQGFERLVVPVAGTAADEPLLALLPRLADRRPVVMTLLYVVAVPQSMALDAELPAEVARGEQALEQAERVVRQGAPLKGGEVFSELLQARSVGAAIVDEAIERNADAIVLAAVLRRRHGRTVLGDTVNYVLLNAPCQVLLLRLDPAASGTPGTGTS